MTPAATVRLSDRRFFVQVQGLWTGSKPPFTTAKVLRSTNFRGDGLLDYGQVAVLNVEKSQLSARQLQHGDILIERSGGGPKQPVGRVAYFDPPDGGSYATSNFTTALRVTDTGLLDPAYVCLVLHALYLSGATEPLQRATTGIRNLDWVEYQALAIPLLPIEEQRQLANFVGKSRNAALIEAAQFKALASLKRAVTKTLFTRGLRGEAQKTTPIGLVPVSWNVERLDAQAKVVSTRMTYSELETLTVAEHDDDLLVLGIKVSDMNLPGNETRLVSANLEKRISRSTVESRCAPPGTIVFPKRGAAIATNKKRLANEWLAFDPNVIGVVAGSDLDEAFLFHWFQAFDLKTITEPGPTPQLNKKNLDPLLIPVPPTLDEQQDIAGILEAIDRKISLHNQKRALLDDLFKALLRKLVTGTLQVADLDLIREARDEIADTAA